MHDIISSGEWCAFTAHSNSSLKWTFRHHCAMCAPLTIKAPNKVSGPDNHTPQQQLNQNVIMSRSICCHHTIPLLFLHNGLLSPHSQSLPLLSVSLSCQKQTKHYCEGNLLLFLCCFALISSNDARHMEKLVMPNNVMFSSRATEEIWATDQRYANPVTSFAHFLICSILHFLNLVPTPSLSLSLPRRPTLAPCTLLALI